MKKIEEFIEKHKPQAHAVSIGSQVPWMLILAASALQTGWGEHAPGNNYFGIKAGPDYKGKTQQLDTELIENKKTKKIKAAYRAYKTAEESYKDFVEVVQNQFPNALIHNDPVDFIISVQTEHKHVYATDPKYAEKIAAVIKTLKQNGA